MFPVSQEGYPVTLFLSRERILEIHTVAESHLFLVLQSQCWARTLRRNLGRALRGGIDTEFCGYAYDHAEVRTMLDKLPNPARTVCMVAAFTGLRASELRGLRWRDYTGQGLSVQQKVWRTHVGLPKTQESKALVPVVPMLRQILNEYRKDYGQTESDFMFYGGKKKFALDLNNLSRRLIAPTLNGGWRGWHAFRRGLATRLVGIGIDASTVQNIMRHADVSLTLGYYVKPKSSQKQAAVDADARGFWGHYGVKSKSRGDGKWK